MPQTKYLSTGEFAKIMNTTKETLFHYEEMGIFYPDHVGKNGYRYYSIHQTDSLDMIMMLRDFGVPLKEIKKSMKHADTAHLLDLYQNEIQSMEQKIQLWKSKLYWLHCQKEQLEFLTQVPEDTVITNEQKQRYYFMEHSVSGSDKDIETKYSILFEKYNDLQTPFGYIMAFRHPSLDILQNQLKPPHDILLFLNKKPAKKIGLHILPAGTYLSVYFCGDNGHIQKAGRLLKDYANKHQLKLAPYFYEFYYANKISITSDLDYYTELTVQILS